MANERAQQSPSQRRLLSLVRQPETPPASQRASVITAAIAQDAFISRSYTLNNPAQVGSGLDGAVRAAAAIASDVEGLGQPDLPMAGRLALSGKVVRDGARFITYSHEVMQGIRLAHQRLAERSPHYQRAAEAAGPIRQRFHHVIAHPQLNAAFDGIKRVGAVGSLGLAVVAAPGLAVSAAQRTTHAAGTLLDGESNTHQKLSAVRDAAYTDAALIYTLAAVPSSIRTLADVGSTGGALRRNAERISNTSAFGRAETFSRRAMPVADVTLLAADGIALYQVNRDPSAGRGEKARAVLNVGLGVTKLALYALPETRWVRTAYTITGVAQLGLAVHGLVTGRRRQP